MNDTARSLSPASWGITRVVEIDSVARAAALDAQAFGGALRHRHRAASSSARAQRLGLIGVAQQVDADVGADRPRRHAVELDRRVGVLGGRRAPSADELVAERADQREQAALERALVQLTS